VASAPAAPPAVAPDPEVAERPKRRSYTAEFKRQILAEAEGCTQPGQLGALLRRHGLYSSHLTSWRGQRARGELAGLTPKKRGPKPEAKNPLADRVAKLERDLARAVARAERAERFVELQKKMAELLGEPLPSDPESGSKR
jgi:transposase-like protein